MRDFVLALGIALVAVLALVLLRGTDAAVVPGSEPSAPRTDSVLVPSQAQPAEAQVATPEPAARATASLWLLPDGTRTAMLNGATDAPPLGEYWGTTVPWSPIVGIERNDQGVDWYRHQNGSYSTTQVVWRSDLQRHMAMTRVAHPAPAAAPAPAARPDR